MSGQAMIYQQNKNEYLNKYENLIMYLKLSSYFCCQVKANGLDNREVN